MAVKRPLAESEVTGIISLFDWEGSSFDLYKRRGPSCLTLDQLVDALAEARAQGDHVRARDLSYYRHRRLADIQKMLRPKH